MSKPQKSDRRAVVDQLRSRQSSAERRRSLLIVGVCALVALAIIGAGAYNPIKSWYDRRSVADVPLREIGQPADVCDDVTTKPADGTQEHVEPGVPLQFETSPPAYGKHYNVWESMDRKLYTKADRPDLGKLVHNQEHGFTILWYDETAADDGDMMGDIRAIAAKFEGTDNQRLKFKAAPWLASDGDPFPDGRHIAFTHWSNGGVGLAATGKQVGVFQYCAAPSGAALEKFMDDYPYMDSPEPDAV